MNSYKNVYPIIGKSMSEVVNDLAKKLSKEPQANELRTILKNEFSIPLRSSNGL